MTHETRPLLADVGLKFESVELQKDRKTSEE